MARILRTSSLVALSATGCLAAAGGGAVAAARPHAVPPLVREARVPHVGTVLVDRAGHTLYRFSADRATKVACTATCAHLWPPLVLPKAMRAPTAAAGLRGLSTIKDPDGQRQVTYRGHPLYTYSGDKKAGEATGQGLLGKWFAVTPTVAALGTHATTTASKSSGGGSGW
ncbi:MAG: hypothetical protein M0004_11510 [Actinomycetota bacterium]|nr:hypothetical protein [Actinomycetota bacterium]